MRALRAENLKLVGDTTRLTDKCADAQRRVDIAVSSEDSLKTQLKSADAAMRGLKEELARTKALVAQTRALCATEVRRRDRQIDTLKKQVGEAGRSRGAKTNPGITTITVTGDLGDNSRSPTRTINTSSDEYSLQNETNSFLASLARNLSEENESLLKAMKQTMGQLREMSGWSSDEKCDSQVEKQPSWEELSPELNMLTDHMRTILTNPSFVPIEEVEIRDEEINRLKSGWMKMENRWEDAVHLMEGWRKRMAASGEPVCEEELKMGLRLSPVRIKEERDSRLAPGFNPSSVKGEDDEGVDLVPTSPSHGRHNDRELLPSVEDYAQEDYEDGEYSGYEDDLAPEEYDVEESNGENLDQNDDTADSQPEVSIESSPLPSPPQLSPLRNSASAGNRGATRNNKLREKPGDFSTILEEHTRELAAEAEVEASQAPVAQATKPVARQLRSITLAERPKERRRSPSRTSLDDALLPKRPSRTTKEVEASNPETASAREEGHSNIERRNSRGFQQIPRRLTSRLAQPRDSDPASQQSPLAMSTIAAKLAASEREADAARVRAKLKAARSSSGGVQKPVIAHTGGPSTNNTSQAAAAVEKPADTRSAGRGENMDPIKHDRASKEEETQQQNMPAEKRKRERRTGKASSRRRSTLSPFELQSLISGNV